MTIRFNLDKLVSKVKLFCLMILLFHQLSGYSQLGFCTGSKGAPIFKENFGSGFNYGPALALGVTNYTFVNSGFPNDGQYTLYHRTNLIPNSQNWLYSLDHTPDNEPDGLNGKCLIVNASNTPGQFYRRVVTGLCSATKFEFSAWLMNIYNAGSSGCPGTGIPINVTFEIWNATETQLLQSGNTGPIAGTSSANWSQFGLVFTMGAGQTSVVLKMKNNGSGGCGNDLAIDDIMFRSCGENSVIQNPNAAGTVLNVCQNEVVNNLQIQVNVPASIPHFYQWEQSNDGINYSSISGENAASISLSNISQTTYYRAKMATDLGNLNNSFCSTISEVYTVVFHNLPAAPIANNTIYRACSNQNVNLSVAVPSGNLVNWYDAPTGGNLLASNTLNYQTNQSGSYYAEAFNGSNCNSSTRTEITVLPLIEVTFSGETTICSGQTTAINLTTNEPNATLLFTATGTGVTGFSNGNGTTINQQLQLNSNQNGSVTYTIMPILNGCEGISKSITITITKPEEVLPVFGSFPIVYCLDATPSTLPLVSNNMPPLTGTWNPAVITTNNSGTSTYVFTPDPIDCFEAKPLEISVTIGEALLPDFQSSISFCKGTNPPILEPISPNGIQGTWNPIEINPLIAGSYIFTPLAGQCATSQTISTLIFEATLFEVTYQLSNYFSDNQIITVLVNEEGSYLYQLDNQLFQEGNVFQNVSTGTHTITVIDKNNCSIPITKEITILKYPYYFTPNNDGINDFWFIAENNQILIKSIAVFDRFGKLIIQLDANSKWDGTFNNTPMPASDYWFSIDYIENSLSKNFKSNFSLKR